MKIKNAVCVTAATVGLVLSGSGVAGAIDDHHSGMTGDNPFWALFGDIAYVLLHLTGIYDLLVAGSSVLA